MSIDRSRLAKWSGVVAMVMMAVYFLAVNTHPIVTTDSLSYLNHSRALGELGTVFDGYRQIGYPMTLAVERVVAGIAGVEPMLFSALVQRLVLAVALGYGVWLWRWKSLPVVVLVLTPSVLVYPNLILTEGLSVPLALLLACLVGHFFRLSDALAPEVSSNSSAQAAGFDRLLALTVIAAAVVLFLITIRYPLAVFGLVPTILLGVAYRRSHRRKRVYAATVIGFVLAGAVFSAAMAIENLNEHDVLLPSTLGKPTQYWGAWRLVFGLYPENQTNPNLVAFFDGGPHPRISQVVEENADYRIQALRHDENINELLSLAGLDRTRERIFSILGALRGGRTDDLRENTLIALRSDARSIDEAINRNNYAIRNGTGAFADQYNDDQLPQALITSPAFPQFPTSASLRTVLGLLLPVALVGILILSLAKRRWLLGSIYLGPVIVLAVAMGWMLLDNVRFLLPGSVYSVAGLSALWDAGKAGSGPVIDR